jgi:plasmid stabilization system protein ParE
MRVEIHPIAAVELQDTIAWYGVHSFDASESFEREFNAAVSRIIDFPTAFSRSSSHTRRCQLHRFPYGIVYRIRGEVITIIAVTHLHRRPGYWKDRLK